MSGVITASEPSWIAPFTGLSPQQFGKLITTLRCERTDRARRGRPWSLPLEDQVLLVVAYWRTNLAFRQWASLFGVSKSAAGRIIDHLGPLLALQARKQFRDDTVLIADGTLVPTRDHTVAEQAKNYRYSTNHQVVIDADSRFVVAIGRPVPDNRNDCKAWEISGAKAAVGHTTVIAVDMVMVRTQPDSQDETFGLYPRPSALVEGLSPTATREEVTAVLGAPERVGPSFDRYEANNRYLHFEFDANSRVAKLSALLRAV